MNAEQLLQHFERISEAPDAIKRLRRFILDLAVRGKLVEQDPSEEPAAELLKRIAAEKARLVKAGEIRKPRDLSNGEAVEKPFSIPMTWRWVRLDAVGAIVGGGTPSSHEADNFAEPGEGIPWLTPADLGGYSSLYISHGARDLSDKGLRISSATLMPKSTVLFTSRAPIGYVAIASSPIATNQGFKSIVPYVEHCSRFIATAMIAFAPGIDASAPGTTFKEVSGKILSAVPFPLPPLAEQHRIVARVDELMSLCDQLEAANAVREQCRDLLVAASLQRLNQPAEEEEPFREHARFTFTNLPRITTRTVHIKQLRQTILNLAVRGKLVEQDPSDESASEALAKVLRERERQLNNLRIKQPSPSEADAQHTPDLPCGWCYASPDQMTAFQKNALTIGPFGSSLLKSDYTDEGVPLIFVRDIRSESFGGTGTKFVSSAKSEELASHRVRPGDLLITKMGDPPGDTAIYPEASPPAIITADCIKLTPHKEIVISEYLRFTIRASQIAEQFAGITLGAAQQKVSLGRFRCIAVPLPPLAEQHRIVAKVDELMAICDQLEAQITAREQYSRRFLESVLADALAPGINLSAEAEVA